MRLPKAVRRCLKAESGYRPETRDQPGGTVGEIVARLGISFLSISIQRDDYTYSLATSGPKDARNSPGTITLRVFAAARKPASANRVWRDAIYWLASRWHKWTAVSK